MAVQEMSEDDRASSSRRSERGMKIIGVEEEIALRERDLSSRVLPWCGKDPIESDKRLDGEVAGDDSRKCMMVFESRGCVRDWMRDGATSGWSFGITRLRFTA